MKTLGVLAGLMLMAGVAHAQQNTDSQVQVNDSPLGQLPASQLFVTPSGGSRMTLGAALAASGGCTTNCTFNGTTTTANLAVSPAGEITVNSAPTSQGVGSIVNNVSSYLYPSTGNERARYWTSILDTTGSPMGLYESNFFFVELTVPGALSNPLITATLSGATVGSLAITNAGSGMTDGTYSLVFAGGGCSGEAGTVTISGGTITATNLTNAGSGCTSVPTVNIAIGNVSREVNQVHPYGQLDAGVSFTGLYDPGEVSFLNNGSLTGTFNDWNALFHNGVSGVAGGVQGLHCLLENDNPNAGSVGSDSCIYIAPMSGQTPTGTGGSVTATQSGGSVTLSFVAGSGYQNGTFNLYITGGSCSREPTGTFTVSGGAITATNLTFAGTSCTSNPAVALFFGSYPNFDYSAQIADPFSTFATQGNVLITDSTGNMTPPAENNMLTIKASSNAGNQFLINGLCGVTGGTCFYYTASGSETLYGSLTVGSTGKNNGSVLFTNAASGSSNITLSPPTGGAVLTAATVTIPDAAGTLAEAITPVVTSSIGGSALAAGACASTTVSATSSTTSMAVVASPVTYPGDGAYWLAYVSAAGTVTVKVCASVAMTPAASGYNVRVIQ